jgi:hypothetical protein
MVFSNPNCATAFDTQGSEPPGRLRLLKKKGYLTPFPGSDTVPRLRLLKRKGFLTPFPAVLPDTVP